MKFSNLWFLACAEMRTCLRLVRTWVFVSIGLLVCVIQWFSLSATHAESSTLFPAAGIYSPRYLTSNLGSTIVLMATLGMLFLAFDIRSRDVRSRMGEVIDGRPFSNIELLTGRLFGIVLLLAIPAYLAVIFFYVFGLSAEAADFRIGGALETSSVFAFLVWDIIPNLLLWGSMTVLAAILFRFRLIVVVLMLVLIGLYFYISLQMPFFLAMAVVTYTGLAALPSELAPEFVNAQVIVNRSLVLLLSGGFLALAAALHPRQVNAGVRPALWITGSAASLLGVFGVWALVMGALADRQQIATWASIHGVYETHSETDVHKVSGVVNIAPGKRIDLDLVIAIDTETSPTEGSWLFNLNPGYKITQISVNGTEIDDYQFENGLLQVPRNNSAASGVEIGIVASGVPNASFAYLDSPIVWSELSGIAGQQLYWLGQENYIFHSQFVALMPGVSWFPTSGAAVGKTAWEDRPMDFFELDIEVVVPRDWTVAGPGTRELVSSERRVTYRFNPTHPIPELAIVGSQFERRALSVQGMELELLVSKKHAENLELLDIAMPHIQSWINERMTILQDSGLEYPFGSLSFVEVPLSLRVYGGGWRADTTTAPPGIQMIRESGLPIARFDNAIATIGEKIETDEHRGEYLYKFLLGFFENDLHGGNPLINVPRNFVNYQTLPVGRGATAIAFVVEELAVAVVTEGDGYFSTHTILERPRTASIDMALFGPGAQGIGRSLEWRERFSDRPSVWNRVVTTSLSGLDYYEDAESAYHMLLLKGKSIARSVIDMYGEETVGAFLRELTSKFRGRTYTEQDLVQVGLDVGLDFHALLGDWLNDASLPGFMVAQPHLERLLDGESGESNYQASFLLRNGESVPGVVAFAYQSESLGKKDWGIQRLDPVRVDGNSTMRIAIQSGSPVRQVWIEPYLSLNREAILVNFPELVDYAPTDVPQLPHIVEADWLNPNADAVIVDDLDDGFSIETPEGYVATQPLPTWLRPFMPYDEPEWDQGLQSGTFMSTWEPWIRDHEPSSYGRYRHTFAQKVRGPVTVNAKFSSSLPAMGRWQLDYHLCCLIESTKVRFDDGGGYSVTKRGWDRRKGFYRIEVLHDNENYELELDLEASSIGWNELGTFDIRTPEVDVVVTVNRGAFGIADAVMWTPLESIN